jgi:hypothetical protein
MVKFLDDKDGQEGLMTDIQVHTRKNYVTSLQGSNILADILVWIMMEDLDNVSIDELDTIETRNLQWRVKFPDHRWENYRLEAWKYREKNNNG